MPPSPRSAPVGEPVTVLVVLENRLTVAVAMEDMQLVLTSVDDSEEGDGMEEEVARATLAEEEFRDM